MTPLHLAAAAQSTKAIQTLLQAGANHEGKNSLGYIPREMVESAEARALFPNAEQPQEPSDDGSEASEGHAIKDRLTEVRKLLNKFERVNQYLERHSKDDGMEFGGNDAEQMQAK